MSVKVAINGFGRIGRNVLKCVIIDSDCSSLFDVVAINDLTDPKTLAHLFKYDSVQGINSAKVEITEQGFSVNGKSIRILADRDPEALPWKELGVDIVVESTGLFTKRSAAEKHVKAGAKKVLISAPATDPDVTLVLGVNDDRYNAESDHIISNASCTTNCLAPIVKVLHNNLCIERGVMTTIHSFTNDQQILDRLAEEAVAKRKLRGPVRHQRRVVPRVQPIRGLLAPEPRSSPFMGLLAIPDTGSKS